MQREEEDEEEVGWRPSSDILLVKNLSPSTYIKKFTTSGPEFSRQPGEVKSTLTSDSAS